MNETKRKILAAGRELFNLYGVASVSQRRIAEHLGISPGNLTYHFKKSNDIVEALYFELVAAMDEAMDQAMTEMETIKYDQSFIFKLVDILVESFFEYRFIFLDFVQIMRNHESIKKHYAQLSLLRKQQFKKALQHLADREMIRKEELPGEYDLLYERFQILADFWISAMVVRQAKMGNKQLENSKKLILQSLYPYLTTEGKKTFLEIYSKSNFS